MTAGAHPFTVVVGMGRSGIGAARLLAARGRRVSLLESKSTPELEQTAAQLRSERIEVHLATPLVPASFETLGTPPTTLLSVRGLPGITPPWRR